MLENPVNVLDAAYYESAVYTTNQLVQDNVYFWMKKYSDCVMILNNIKELLTLYNAGDIHSTLKDMLQDIPSASDPPAVPQLYLHMPYVAERDTIKPKRKHTPSPPEVYHQMKSAYMHKQPCPENQGLIPIPENTDNMDLSQMETHIVRCRDIVREIDNMALTNSANFGHWLEISFKTFRQNKMLGKITFPNFAAWVNDRCGITERWAKELRHFYQLAADYPQILFCRLSLAFFKLNRRHIYAYFSSDPVIGNKWKHALSCPCANCGP